MKPLRVLNISHSSVVRSYQDRLPWIAAEPDIELTVILPERYKIGPEIVEAYRGDGTYKVITLPTVLGRSDRQMAYWYKGLGKTVRSIAPDVIYLEQEPEAVSTFQTVQAARSLMVQPPIVGITWRNLPMPLPSWSILNPKRYVYPWIQRRTLPHINVLTQGTPDAERFFRELGFKGLMPTMPMHGIDDDLFRPPVDKQLAKRSLGLDKEFVVGFVGRFIPMKGLDDLVHAVYGLGPRATLLLVGSGPEEGRIRTLARSLGMADRLMIINWVPREELVGLMQAMDVLSLPSRTTDRLREQFGRVLIEAMACEVAVVGSDSGDIPRVIDRHGLVFPEGNVDALKERLRTLMENDALRLELAHSGLQYVHETYSSKVLAARLVEIFRDLARVQDATSRTTLFQE